MKKSIFIINFFFITLIAYSFQMTPISFEKNIDKENGFKEFYFPNNSSKTIRYKFSILPGSSNRKDMSKWIEYYPKVLIIKPEEVGVLKIFVKSPKETQEGEYGFFLDILPIDILSKDLEEEKIKAASSIKIRAAVEMVGYVGDIEPEIVISSYRVYSENSKEQLETIIENSSNKRGGEITLLIKGKNSQLIRKDLGRISKNGKLKIITELKGIKKRDLYELEIIETLTNKTLKKINI